jgi:DNA-directed RNA polymerase specialized sigma24 family protein
MSARSLDDASRLAGRLFAEHGAALYRYALLLLGDSAAAEDAVQQVFVALLRRSSSIAVDNESQYLRRAVRNACFSAHRRNGVRAAAVDSGALLTPHRDGQRNGARTSISARRCGRVAGAGSMTPLKRRLAIRTWSEVIEAARRPVIAAPNPSPEERVALETARSNTCMAWKGSALESLSRAAQAEGLTVDRASLVAVGVELFRRAHGGALPATLEEIVPEYLDAVPAVPATGRPLRYTRHGNSYTVTGEANLRVVIHH